MNINKLYPIKITQSVQCDVRKATPEEISHAEYIPEDKKDNMWLYMDNELKVKTAGSLTFCPTEISAYQLFINLTNGHCVSGLFNRPSPFQWKGSFNGQWKGAQVIFLDADDSKVSMQETIEALKYKPTFAMTTQSHMMPGKLNRFRLAYVFKDVMHNFDGFSKIALALMLDVEQVIRAKGHEGFKLDRNCTLVPGRFFLGNPKSDIEYWTSWNIYQPTDIVSVYDDTPLEIYTANKIKEKGKETQRKRTNAEKKNVVHRKRHHPKTFLHKDVGLQMEQDCHNPNMTIEQIVQEYSLMYRVRFETSLKQFSAEYPFIPYQEGYLKIYFRSEWGTDHTGKRVKKIKPFRNGEGRHIMLMNQLILVIAMNYDRICYDDLLYHGLYLFSIGYVNKNLDGTDCVGEDVFTPQRIKSIVDEAWSEDLNYRCKMIEKAKKDSEFGFKVNPETAGMLGMSKRKLLPMVKKFYTYCVWIERIQLIEQDILLMGKTYKELAKILSEKLGKEIKHTTLGTHVREWRKSSEIMEFGDKNVTKNWLNPIFPSNSTQNPIYTTSPNTPYTPIKKENILSKTNKMTPQDLGITEKHYYELTVFMEYYDNNKTNTENRQYMKSQGLKMSESTYKRNKRLMNKIKNIEEQRHSTI